MAQSFVTYTGNGTLTSFVVPFEYIDKTHVKVYLNGADTTSFTWPSSGQISFATAPTNGTVILIRRETPSTPLVDFTSRAQWKTSDLNLATNQSLFRAIEAIELANKWLSGFGTPPATDGDKEGDYYFDTVSGDVYTRDPGSWTLVGNIKGDTGATGTTGSQGPQGPVGSGGDMYRATYDTNNDGVVDAAGSVPWVGITGKPSTFTPSSHVHSLTDVTGLQSALDGKLGVTANAASAVKLETARTITLTGDVSGSGSFDGSSNLSIATTGVGAFPAGAVVPFYRAAAPSGWLVANGSAVSRTTYAALWGALGSPNTGDGSTTFTLPDLRGEFIRGLDEGRGVDSGRTLGSSQLDQMQRLTGQFNSGPYTVGSSGAFTQTGTAGTLGTGSGTRASTAFDSGNSPNARVSSTTSGETRPRNIALLMCIKT